MAIHSLYPNKVRLDEEQHRYFDASGQEYIGFSSAFEFIHKKFDAHSISRFVAKAKGVSAQEVRDEWSSKTDNGTRIDKALELYAKSGQILKEDEDIAELVKSVLAEYKIYNSCYEQLVVYNEETRTAGSLDKLFIFSNRKDSAFGISDFKSFESDNLHEHRGWLSAPFEHLPSTKYTKICFQLSYYAYHFELLTGKKCKSLFIHLIDPVNKTHQKIPVTYLKNDIKIFLESYKPFFLAKLDKREMEAF